VRAWPAGDVDRAHLVAAHDVLSGICCVFRRSRGPRDDEHGDTLTVPNAHGPPLRHLGPDVDRAHGRTSALQGPASRRGGRPVNALQQMAKRALDVTGATCGLALLAPLL